MVTLSWTEELRRAPSSKSPALWHISVTTVHKCKIIALLPAGSCTVFMHAGWESVTDPSATVLYSAGGATTVYIRLPGWVEDGIIPPSPETQSKWERKYISYTVSAWRLVWRWLYCRLYNFRTVTPTYLEIIKSVWCLTSLSSGDNISNSIEHNSVNEICYSTYQW